VVVSSMSVVMSAVVTTMWFVNTIHVTHEVGSLVAWNGAVVKDNKIPDVAQETNE